MLFFCAFNSGFIRIRQIHERKIERKDRRVGHYCEFKKNIKMWVVTLREYTVISKSQTQVLRRKKNAQKKVLDEYF